MSSKTIKPNPFKDCLKCGMPVHARSAVCKACGAPSPWAKEVRVEVQADSINDTAIAAGIADAVDRIIADDPHATGADTPEARAAARAFFEKPRVIDSTADDFNPSPEEVAVFLHDITSPARAEAAERAAELEARNGPHVFLEKHSTLIGDTIAHFKAGQVVTDFALIQVLKAQGNAPMVPTANAPGMTCCPRCSHIFKIPSVLPTRRTG